MTKEFIESLRERFDGKGPITMSELDLLIRYADEAVKFRSEFDAWLAECPANGVRS